MLRGIAVDVLNRVIDLSLRYRGWVLLATAMTVVFGVLALTNLDIDAFPDTTPVQVQINTSAAALSPEEVERQVTFPVEQSISGLKGLELMRSISKFGLSQVVVVFKEGTDIYFARQLIQERISTVDLPSGLSRPQMGPVSTGLGEVLHYLVEGNVRDKSELRTQHDWTVKPPMKTVPGTAEINSWGGYVRQFQILIDPDRLIEYGLTFDQAVRSVETNNSNVGGGNISQSRGMLLVQGIGKVSSIEQIEQIVIDTIDGVPIQLKDVGKVIIGHEIRRGAVTANGRGEVVLGLGFMLMGENSHHVTVAMKDKLETVEKSLPANVQIRRVYDRTVLVDQVLDTVRSNLFEGGLFVIAILFAFLGNLRAAVIVAVAIPLSMCFAFTGMYRFGIAASLLSLGAIDFGLVVDSSVVMVENCVRQLADPANSNRNRLDIIRDAAIEVRRPTMFGELIIAIVYLPILTLEGIEGKLFRPMALTVIFALIGSMILSLTLMPVLASYFLPRVVRHEEPWLMKLAHRIHGPILRFSMNHQVAVLGIAATLLVFSFGLIAPNLGTEFIPDMSEGAIAIGITRLAGTDLEESIRINTLMERELLRSFPDEVENVWSRIGSAEIATDPMGVELTDMYITLKPRDLWTKAQNQERLTELIDLSLREFQGQRLSYSQPIEMRINEMTSGVRTDLGIKLYGDDFDVLVAKAKEIVAVVNSVKGASDVAAEQVTGQGVLQIRIDQEQIARYGVSADYVLSFVESIGNRAVGEIIDGQLRFPIVVRLPESIRSSPQAISEMLITTADGKRVPLGRLAKVEVAEGPSTITREWGQRRITVTANVVGRDLGSFVEEVQRRVASKVTLPKGRYRIEYGGQFEHFESARKRLLIVVPITLGLIYGLLFITYGNMIDTIRVFTGIPFAWVGGIIALWIRDMPFSISAAIGFIAMSGVAVLDDMLLVSTIRQFLARGLSVDESVTRAAITRLRPVLMTTLVASFGFLPMALSDGVGAEVQRPLATVVIGGVLGAMIMSLLVLRVLYMVFDRFRAVKKSDVSIRKVSEPNVLVSDAIQFTKES
jgi:cobalt-zinc-cadmium resistance protein CzcA